MQDIEGGGRKNKFNTKTFAIKDNQGNIYVVVPVLIYRDGDLGYPEMEAKFRTQAGTDSSTEIAASSFDETSGYEVTSLDSEWCLIEPQNSSANF